MSRISWGMPCPSDITATEYKLLQKLAYEGHTGSNIVDIAALMTCVAGAVLAVKIVFSRCPTTHPLIQLGVSFLWILVLTAALVGEGYVSYLLVGELLVILAALIIYRQPRDAKTIDSMFKEKRKTFIDLARFLLLMSVSTGILAVDFQAYPRELAKTETYGLSLMDIGAGLFIVSGAIPASRYGTQGTTLQAVRHALLSSAPLLVIGLGRLMSVKGVQYNEHVSEYGVHWNFFFTLSFVSLLSTFLQRVLAPRTTTVVGVGLLCGHQYALSQLGLSEYVIEAPRTDIISANKEGIVSSVGYLGLYLIGLALGRQLLGNRPSRMWWSLIGRLTAFTVSMFSLLYVLELYGIHPSRRMPTYPSIMLYSNEHLVHLFNRVNLPYAVAVLGLFIMQILLCLVTDIGLIARPVSFPLMDAINRNQLFVFLLANVMTGVINMSMNTLCVSNTIARMVIFLYLSFLCLVAYALHRANITLKFW